jgi:hypothetical protein
VALPLAAATRTDDDVLKPLPEWATRLSGFMALVDPTKLEPSVG